MEFTGERFIPGKTSRRLAEDHIARYKFAGSFVHGKTVLDVACGTGYGSAMLKQQGAALVQGVDVDAAQVAEAQSLQAEGLEFSVGDIAELDTGHQYDLITSFETIEHIQDYNKALRSLFSVLKPGGLLIISTPNRLVTSPWLTSLDGKPKNPFHVREFTVPELVNSLREIGFEVAPSDLYGQRQQKFFKNRYIRRLYKIIFKPDIKGSSEVTLLRAQPRYMVIVAHKS